MDGQHLTTALRQYDSTRDNGMNCPTDGTELRMSDRQGIEIDYCPTCRGVWLDRGELDKIIERTALVMEGALPDERYRPASPADRGDLRRDDAAAYQPRGNDDAYRSRHDDDDDDHRYGSQSAYGTRKKKSRRSFLGDLFEID